MFKHHEEEYHEILKKIDAHKPEGSKILKTVLYGSYAYGTQHENSDVDIRGVYIANPRDFLGTKEVDMEFTIPDHDAKWFELKKFVRLVGQANTNALEILHLVNEKSSIHHMFDYLYFKRRSLYGKTPIFNSYNGHAGREARLGERDFLIAKETGDEELMAKSMKQWRHGFRLLIQGEKFLSTGNLQVALYEDEVRFLNEITGKRAELDRLKKLFDSYTFWFNQAYENSKMNELPNQEEADHIVKLLKMEVIKEMYFA